MNRRDFLGLFRGLAVLPFVKPLSLKATERTPRRTFTVKAVKTTRGDFFPLSQVQPGQRIKLLDTDEVVEWRIGGNSKDIVTKSGQVGKWGG